VRKSDKPLLVKQSISSVEEVLPADLFLRVHRSYIIAIDKVAAFTNHDIEIAGMEIPIGRLYAQQLDKLRRD
ncbi:MAG TPA: LytTR family DNA-binding domain-containing protein, partial [Chitinophagaceae bacterium]|nr:LytTR family DNA-binding domain-containing protein [Chitinophagaceae bacterium]